MENESKIGAWQAISLLVTTALLLLWMDGWSHSVPVMIVTAIVALVVFVRFRNASPGRKLTYGEQVMLEKESARRWMARHGADSDPPEPKRPDLRVIDGGKAAPESDDSEDDAA